MSTPTFVKWERTRSFLMRGFLHKWAKNMSWSLSAPPCHVYLPRVVVSVEGSRGKEKVEILRKGADLRLHLTSIPHCRTCACGNVHLHLCETRARENYQSHHPCSMDVAPCTHSHEWMSSFSWWSVAVQTRKRLTGRIDRLDRLDKQTFQTD